MVFRKSAYLAAKERWFWDDQKLEVVNAYKYLGLIFFYWTQFYCSNGRHCNQSQKRYNRNFKNTKKDWL